MLISKLQAKMLTWVSRAKETPAKGKKPQREILTGVHFTDTDAISADGFRLFAAKDIALPELAGRTVELTKITPNTASVDVTVEPEGTFPNYAMIIPKREPVATVYVNADLLRDALTELKAVKLLIYGEHDPMEVYGKIEEQPVYALIMPMCGKYLEPMDWKPS